MKEWAFLSDHAAVLVNVARQPGVSIRQLATMTGFKEKACRRMMADLHGGGYVTRKREGRELRYYLNTEALPVHTAREQAFDDFLEALG